MKSKVMTAEDVVRARHGYSQRGWGSASRDSRKSRDFCRDKCSEFIFKIIFIFSKNYMKGKRQESRERPNSGLHKGVIKCKHVALKYI